MADCLRNKKKRKRNAKNVQCPSENTEGIYRQWHWGKAYIICIFHEIINIILFYISFDRRFNSISCAMHEIAISKKKKRFLSTYKHFQKEKRMLSIVPSNSGERTRILFYLFFLYI